MKLNVLNKKESKRWKKEKETKQIRCVLVLREQFIRCAPLDLDSVRYNWDINTRKVCISKYFNLVLGSRMDTAKHYWK